MSSQKLEIPQEARDLWNKIDESLAPLVDFHEWDDEWTNLFNLVQPLINELEEMGYVYAIDEPIRPVTRLYYVKDMSEILFVSMNKSLAEQIANRARNCHKRVRVETKTVAL